MCVVTAIYQIFFAPIHGIVSVGQSIIGDQQLAGRDNIANKLRRLQHLYSNANYFILKSHICSFY